MRRHPTDLVGLLFGSAFLIAGGAFLVREATDTVVNPVWVTGLGLMLLGAIALVATIARNIRQHGDESLAIADAPTVPLVPEDVLPEGAMSEAVTSDD